MGLAYLRGSMNVKSIGKLKSPASSSQQNIFNGIKGFNSHTTKISILPYFSYLQSININMLKHKKFNLKGLNAVNTFNANAPSQISDLRKMERNLFLKKKSLNT